jgi:hypothetical protein
MTTIHVFRFVQGNQGEIRRLDTIRRRIHRSHYYAPEHFLGSRRIERRICHWIRYAGVRWAVLHDSVEGHWSLNLTSDEGPPAVR